MSHKVFRLIVSLVLALAFFTVAPTPQPARAAGPWYVATTGDDNNDCLDPSTPCATINGAIGKASAGDTINVAVGTYTGTGDQVVLIDKDITLSGGWDVNFSTQSGMSTIDGQSARRGVTVNGSVTATIEKFVTQNGYDSGYGGGISINSGTVTLNNSVVSSNTADTGGGGIENRGTVTLNNSIVSGNTSNFPVGAAGGGGIGNTGMVTLNNSTISGNIGGGISTWGIAVTLNNSTVSGNTTSASDIGGGISNYNYSMLTLNNSTVSGNTSSYGGGIYNGAGTVLLKNTILAGNSTSVSGPDCWGPIDSAGYNLIGDTSGCTIAVTTGDLTDIDPFLGQLQDNGGSTFTHALLPQSPAIDAGNIAGCTDQDGNTFATDQRGVTRPQGIGCDIGAYEYTFTTPGPATSLAVLTGSNQVTNLNHAFPKPLRVVALDDQGNRVSGVTVTFMAPASGSSGTFADTGTNTATVDTDAGGVATTSIFTANNITGAYTVLASSPGLGPVDFSLEQVERPANDNFVNATSMSPLPFSDTVDTTWATVEPDESHYCDYSPRTVWYTFTPTANAEVKVTTEGSSFSDIVLTAYRDTGGGLTGLNAFTCVSYVGSLTFAVEQDVIYYIQAGYISSSGELHVNLQEVPPPANDNFADATVITSPLPYDDTVDASGATSEVGEPVSSCASAGYGGPYKSIWFAYTPATSGVISANVPSAAFAPVLAAYTGSGMDNLTELGCQVFAGNPVNVPAEAGTTYYFQVSKYTTWDPDGSVQFQLRELNPPANDNFNDATSIGTLPFSNTVDITDATIEHGEPQYCYYSSRTVWYSFTPTANMLVQADMFGSSFGDTIFNVYQSFGSGFGGLNFMQCAYFGNSATFNVQAGQTYYIQAGSVYSSSGNLQLNLQELPRPANDDFGSAKAITALPYSDTVDISNATREANEPSYCYYSSKTVWYSLTPTENTLVKVDMQGSSFWDSVFNVYQAIGPNITDLSPLQCAGFGSSVTFTAQAGTTYYIQAGSYYGSSGSMQLNLVELPRPANDDFANATVVTLPLPFDNTVDTQYSSRQTGEPTPTCAYNGPGTRSVWYAFTPAINGSVSAGASSYAFTSVLAVYTGTSLTSLTQVGCQSYGNLLTFHVDAGTTYYFQVGNLYPWEQGGSVQFHLDVTPPPTAGFYYYPSDPSVFDTIQFYDGSYDPGQVGFDSVTWDFGDGTTSVAFYPSHIYAKDGDYTVQHSVTTFDGRTASVTQVVQVRTHDVAITKINAPQSASAKQTRAITVSVNSKGYAETVRVDLYKSVPGGFEFIGSVTLPVPARSNNKTIVFNFSYTFTNSDASIGKVTFKAVATIIDARDAYPADNEAVSSPPTKITK